MLPRRNKTTTQNPLLMFAEIVIPHLAPIHEKSEEHEAITQEPAIEEKGDVSAQEPASALGGKVAPQEPISLEKKEQAVVIFPQEPVNRGGGMDGWVEARIKNKQHKQIVILFKQNICLKKENKQLKQTLKSQKTKSKRLYLQSKHSEDRLAQKDAKIQKRKFD